MEESFLILHCDLDDRKPTFAHDTLCHDDAPSYQVLLQLAYGSVVQKISSGQRCDTRTDGQPGSNMGWGSIKKITIGDKLI